MPANTLFTGPLTRGDVVLLLLDEAGPEVAEQYQLKTIDIRLQQHHQEAFVLLNKKARVPVLQTEDGLITETHAILLDICRRHGLNSLAPAPDDPLWPDFSSLLFFLAGELDPVMKRFFYAERYALTAAVSDIEKTRSIARREMQEKVDVLEQAVVGPFALGDQLSVIDLFLVYWMVWTNFVAAGPAIRRLVEAVAGRPRLTQRVAAMRAEASEWANAKRRGGGGEGSANSRM